MFIAPSSSATHTYHTNDRYNTAITPSHRVPPPKSAPTIPVHATCRARLNDDPTDFYTVQAAVDASTHPTDVVKVAGYCTGVEGRPAPPGYNGPAVITQVVYISKSLTIEGGYTFTNWTTPDPQANPTTLDAQGQGRVLFVAGAITPTIWGLRLTGGEAKGLGGSFTDSGGGAYVRSTTVTISNCAVFSNSAVVGGGLALEYLAKATVVGNTITNNTAYSDVYYGNPTTLWGYGGGVFVELSHAATVHRNTISGNSANWGGGMFVSGGMATLTANVITSNTVATVWWGQWPQFPGLGGGICVNSGTATVERNIISGNAATVAAGRPLSFTWAFGDGPSLVVGPSSVVSHVYLTVGLYTAVVTASNHVSSATASTPVIIVPPYRLYLPLVLRF